MNNVPLIWANPQKFSEQEEIYLTLREQEGRIYSDQELTLLPLVPKNHPLSFEWKVRKNSSERLIQYLSSKRPPLKILEIGCGNGWLSYKMSKIDRSEVTGLDINMTELGQAARVFGHQQNLKFVYADIFESSLTSQKFDIIVVAAVIQYFPEPKKLIDQLMGLLRENGEIHIFDSPLYKSEEESFAAHQRSSSYFHKQGAPAMNRYYFHHSNLFLNKYPIKQVKPSLVDKVFKRFPFPWVIIKKDSEK